MVNLTGERLTVVQRAASRFVLGGEIISIQEFGAGNINDTYLVTTQSQAIPRVIVQRLNHGVFHSPESVMANIHKVTELVAHSPQRQRGTFLLPSLFPTRDGRWCFKDESGNYWRAMSFIEGTRSLAKIRDARDGAQIGRVLGLFHRLTAAIPIYELIDTLPGFHVTPQYLAEYDRVRSGAKPTLSDDARFCQDFIELRREFVPILENARERGELQLRPTHGDPKVDNVLFDAKGMAVSIIDLDTVKPGLIHYDLGDCLRSACNRAGENASLADVAFDLETCDAVLAGYSNQAGDMLTAGDIRYLFAAIRLIPFELGLRFFSDYLAGNKYFKVKDSEHNLRRALVQFQLARSIESQQEAIEAIISKSFSC